MLTVKSAVDHSKEIKDLGSVHSSDAKAVQVKSIGLACGERGTLKVRKGYRI